MPNTLLPIQHHGFELKPWAEAEAHTVLSGTAHMLKAWCIPLVFATGLRLQQDETYEYKTNWII